MMSFVWRELSGGRIEGDEQDQEGQNLILGMLPLSLPSIQEFKLGDAKPPQANHLDTE